VKTEFAFYAPFRKRIRIFFMLFLGLMELSGFLLLRRSKLFRPSLLSASLTIQQTALKIYWTCLLKVWHLTKVKFCSVCRTVNTLWLKTVVQLACVKTLQIFHVPYPLNL